MFKVNLRCVSCGSRFSVELDGGGVHTVRCPVCSAPQDVTVRSNVPKQKAAPVTGSAAVAQKVRRCEVFSGIVWIVVGVIQCCTVYAAAAGVWNIINSVVSLRNVKNITAGNPAVIPYFEQRKVWLIVLAVVNLILGGVVGVLLVLFDWHVRDFVLRNRSAFEG